MQQRFANVDPVVAVPNAVSVEAHDTPGPGMQQLGAAAPGVHAALLASVQVVAAWQVLFAHVPPLQECPHEPQFSGSEVVSTQVFEAAQ